ncbi:zinc-binding dehydrogenase [Micromonospora sp. NPDC048947]|uniref:zinc-binding dehydrogenase n=1 Tax=Micromonospora sp. NPDC048947 TaxID=3154826 RepID=UPI0033CB9029
MRAAWYDRQGPAREVLEVGELPDPWPGAANEAAASELTAALVAGDLRYPIAARLPLAEIAHAHELAEHSSASGRVVLDI